MPSPSNTPRTQIHRKPQRAHHDAATIRAIIDAALVCQIAFNQGGSVHCLPKIGRASCRERVSSPV